MDQRPTKHLKVPQQVELVQRMLSIIEDENLSGHSTAIDFSRKISVLDAINCTAKSWRWVAHKQSQIAGAMQA